VTGKKKFYKSKGNKYVPFSAGNAMGIISIRLNHILNGHSVVYYSFTATVIICLLLFKVRQVVGCLIRVFQWVSSRSQGKKRKLRREGKIRYGG